MISAALPGRIDQVAYVVPDLEAAMDAYAAQMGLRFGVFEVDETSSSFSGSSSRFRIRIAVALAGLVSIELIQPVSGDTIYSRQLAGAGPGIHHIGVYVDDLAKASQSLAASGYRCLLDGQIRGLGEFAYFEAPDLHCTVEILRLSFSFPAFLVRRAKWHSAKPRTS
jgi:catechol 2,3-dioxygenase-like lactoylglutathione lyase family enzyme